MSRLCLILLILASLLLAFPAAAQENQPPGTHPDCERIDGLMALTAQTGITPDQIVRGGGSIRDSTPVQASISADDAGDRWVFGAVNTQVNGMSQITLDTDVPLMVRVFKGLTPVNLLQGQDNGRGLTANLGPGVQTVTAMLIGDGYYTVVVQRQNLTDSSQTGAYTLSIGANVAGGLTFAPVDWRGQQAAQQSLIPPDGDGIVTFMPEASGSLTLRVPVDALRSVTVERSIVLELAGSQDGARGSLSWVREYVRELALLDGDLSIHLNNGGFIHIAGYAGTGRDTITDLFSNFSLQDDGRSVRGINWNTIQNLWLLPGCLGIELRAGGQRFIAEGTGLTVSEQTAASGALGQTLAVSGGTAAYNLALDWGEIEQVAASNGLVEVGLTDNRSLLLDRLNIAISQPPDAPFRINEGTTSLLTTDWVNTQRVEIEGDRLRVVVNDLREAVERRGRILRTLETHDGIMRAFWQDDSQTLLLPEANDFIEIDTPAALPAANLNLRPRQVDEATGSMGYLPANLNNAGQACFPVNTVFDFNCAPNGEVNPANGGLSMAVTDLYARGARLDLTLSRTYNSHHALVDGPFGKGWNTDYLLDYAVDYTGSRQSRLVSPGMAYPVGLDVTYAPLGMVVYTEASGSRHVFERDDDGWRSGTMPGWFIALRADVLTDDWHLARDDGTVYDFDIAGRLKRIRHLYGGALEIRRESFDLTNPNAETVYSIADATGRRIVLTFDANRHITRSDLLDDDTLLESVAYAYNVGGYLTSVTYGDGAQARYEYTENGLLHHHDDPRAPLAQSLYYGYDEQGRVHWIDSSASVTPEACTEAAETVPLRCYAYASSSNNQLETTVTDQWGRAAIWRYSTGDDPETAFRLLAYTAPDGLETTYTYGSGNLARFPVNFSRGGLQHALRWEPFGKPSNFQADTWVNFSAVYNISTLVDINGDGAPEYRLPLLTEYRTDGNSGPIQPTRYTYDPASGLPVSVTESSGLVRRIDTRDSTFNQPTVVTSTAGETTTVETFAYDDYGFITTRRDATGIDQTTWDSFGRPVHYERQNGIGTPLAAYDITYTVTDDGRCMTVTDPLGTQTVTCYDQRSRLAGQTITDSGGTTLEATTYAYDTLDRLVRVRSESIEFDPVITTYDYLPGPTPGAGQRTVVETLPSGAQRVTDYDAVDRVIRVEDETGQVTSYTYPAPTASTETVTERTSSGAETTYEYNRARQLIRLDYGPVEWGVLYGGSRASTQREPSQITLSSGQGASTTIDFESYDSAGRLTEASFIIRRPNDDNLNAEPQRSDNTRADMTLRYTYDAHGNLLAIENPVTSEATRLSHAAFEQGGRSVTVDYGDEQFVTYVYDAVDRLVSVENGAAITLYNYRYNVDEGLLEVSAVISDEDGAQYNWLLNYDSLGNLREWRDEDGQITRYAYDARSRLVRVVHIDSSGDQIPVVEYAYNTDDQVTTIINRDGLEARYVYNERGQLTTRRDFDGVVSTFIYDPQGNVQAVTDGLGFTTTYRYDSRNQLAAITDPLGRQVRFTRDLSNIGELIVNGDVLGQTRYVFDLYDRLWQIQDAQGSQHLLRYDSDGHVSEWRQADGALTLGLQYGLNDVLTAIDGPDGWDWAYDYNLMGQLVGRTDPDGNQLALAFDGLGRLTELADRTFDRPQAGVLDVTRGGQHTTYAYDYFDRLLQETRGDAEVAYEYRDDGHTFIGPDGQFTEFINTGVLGDPEVPYLIVEEYSAAGELARERYYRYSQRGQLTGIESRDYLAGTDVPYRTEARIDYDAVGRPIRYIDSENNLYAYSYDLAGRLNTLQYPDGGIYTYEYDRLNQLAGLVNPTGERLSLAYDPLGHLNSISLNNTTLETYRWSPQGWLLARIFPDYADGAGQIAYNYSAGGMPQGWSIGGSTVTLEHDAFGLLTSVTDGAGEAVTYSYDDTGNLTGAGGLLFSYDDREQLTSAGGVSYSQTVGDDGRTLTITLPDGQTLTVLIDPFGHVQRVDADGQTVDVAYDLLEGEILEARMTWGGRYVSLLRFNQLGQVQLLQFRDDDTSQRIQRFAYTSNFAGLPLAIDDRENDILLGYDNVFRPLTTSWLVTAGLKPQDSVDYALTVRYDDLGNRVQELRQTVDGRVEEAFYTYDQTGTLLRSRAAESGGSGVAAGVSGVVVFGLLIVGLRRRPQMMLPALLVCALTSGWLVAQAQTTPAFEYRYNDAGHLASVTDNRGTEPVMTAFVYDGFERLIAINRDETSTTFEYDALGRLIARNTPDGRTEYRYNGDQLISIMDEGHEWLAVTLLDDQYLLLTDGTDSRWTLYDVLGAQRQSFVNEHTDPTNVANRFDMLGRVLTDRPVRETPLMLPLYDGMLYDADYGLYIGLDGRAYDPATGRYLQRSLTGPDAVGNLYGFTPLPARPPAQIFEQSALVEPLMLLDEYAHLLDAPTASSVMAEHLPDMYAGWQDVGLAQMSAFQAAQQVSFTRLAGQVHSLIYDYNRASILPDDAGRFRLYGITHAGQPAQVPALPAIHAPLPMTLPDVSLRWSPPVITAELASPRWFDDSLWRDHAPWSVAAEMPQPLLGERAPGAITDLLALPLADVSAYADFFRALDHLPVADSGTWMADIEAGVLPVRPAAPPRNVQEWLGNWFTDDTLPVWSALRRLHALPDAPGLEVPALNLR